LCCYTYHERAGPRRVERAREGAQNKITLVIAHRLSTVVERSSHVQLLALDGQYARMWALQEAGE
jgi:ABC-type transport system involved in Fe-S cluster assembly fused permease/ATPase subunit